MPEYEDNSINYFFSSKPEASQMLLYLVLYKSLVEVILVFNLFIFEHIHNFRRFTKQSEAKNFPGNTQN